MCSEQWKTHFSVPAKAKLIGIWQDSKTGID